jgi:hypothetical protein
MGALPVLYDEDDFEADVAPDDVHAVRTEPPPASGDAYNAPTRIGPMTNAMIASLMEGSDAPASGVHSNLAAEKAIAAALAPRPVILESGEREIPKYMRDEDDSTLEPTSVGQTALNAAVAANGERRESTPKPVALLPTTARAELDTIPPEDGAPPPPKNVEPAAIPVAASTPVQPEAPPMASTPVVPMLSEQTPEYLSLMQPRSAANRALTIPIIVGVVAFVAVAAPALIWLFR